MLFLRIKNNYTAKNPLTQKIKTDFPLIYDIAVYIAQILNKDYSVLIDEDEIAFIAFHIGSYLENSNKNQNKISCIFIPIITVCIKKLSKQLLKILKMN